MVEKITKIVYEHSFVVRHPEKLCTESRIIVHLKSYVRKSNNHTPHKPGV